MFRESAPLTGTCGADSLAYSGRWFAGLNRAEVFEVHTPDHEMHVDAIQDWT